MKTDSVNIGQWVTCKDSVEAYYSNYGVNKGLSCWFTADDVGIVTATPPNVTGRNTTFVLVEFRKYGGTWQAALDWPNVQPASLERRQKNGIITRERVAS